MNLFEMLASIFKSFFYSLAAIAWIVLAVGILFGILLAN